MTARAVPFLLVLTVSLLGIGLDMSPRPVLAGSTRPHPWAPAFSMRFRSGQQQVAATKIGSPRANGNSAGGSTMLPGVMYYAWEPLRAQRIDHVAPGTYECGHFYNISGSCTLWFFASAPREGWKSGLYAHAHDGSLCCHDLDLGPPPPDWMVTAGGTFNGTVRFSGEECDEWAFPGLHVSHRYYSREKPQEAEIPCGFTFPDLAPGVPNPQNMHFEARSFDDHTPAKRLFDLPSDTCRQQCPKPSSSRVGHPSILLPSLLDVQ
jgi:hypothetical protein